MSFSLQIIDNFSEFLKLKDEWNNLLSNSGNSNVFLTHEWFSCWWKAYGGDKSLFVVLVRENKVLKGIAPLMKTVEKHRGLRTVKIKFIENENSFRCDFIIDGNREEVLGEIIEHLYGAKHSWDMIQLNNFAADSPNYKPFSFILNNRKSAYGIKKGLSSPYLNIDSGWEEYISGITKRVRQNMRNKYRRLEKKCDFSVERVTDYEKSVNDVFKISAASWKSSIGKAITQSEKDKRFFTELTKTMAEKGLLDIWLLKIEGMPAAYEYHLRHGGTVFSMKADYDEGYKSLSAGAVLNSAVLRERHKDGTRQYDMGGTCDKYKLDWTSTVREHFNFYLFNSGIESRFLYFTEFYLINSLRKTLLPLRRLINRIIEIKTYEGIRGVVKKGTARIFKTLYSHNSAIWFEKDISDNENKPSSRLPIDIETDRRKEVIRWLKDQKKAWLANPKEFKTAEIYNHFFPCAKLNGEIIGCAKIGFKNVYISDYKRLLRFPDKTAFIYDTYVVPEMRGNGVAPAIITEAFNYLKNRGYNKVKCHIPEWNGASVRTYKKLGFNKLGKVHCHRPLGMTILSRNPLKIERTSYGKDK